MTLRFTSEPLLHIANVIREALQEGVVEFEVVSPNVSADLYAGEPLDSNGVSVRYRSFHTWMELAEGLSAILERTEPLGDGFVRLRMRSLRPQENWHEMASSSGDTEKYGTESAFARTSKLEMPSFFLPFLEGLDFINLPKSARILSLGVNQGEELALIQRFCDERGESAVELVGIDHSASAIQAARSQNDGASFRFHVADIQELDDLDLGRFDLVVSINTLHSPALDGHEVFQRVVQQYLTPNGGVMVGVPNSRHIDHQLMYGARMKNFSTPDLSVLWKEVGFYRRYLHQHGFQVRLLGKHTVLVAGRKP